MSGTLTVLAGVGSNGGGGGEFSAVADPSDLQSITNTTAASSITLTGGTAAFVYQWTMVGGSGVTALTPTASSTQFVSAIGGPPAEQSATFQCSVQDSTGLIAYSNTVSVIVYQGGGPT